MQNHPLPTKNSDALAHTSEAEHDEDGKRIARRMADVEAHQAAARAADAVREMLIDLIVDGDAAGVEAILAGVRALGATRAAVDLARRRATQP